MKEKIKKEYFRRTRKLFETKLYCRNLIEGIDTWAVTLENYSGPFLKWTREELKQMDHRTRKQMTMHKALHPRDDVDILYVSRKGGRGFASIYGDASIKRLEIYIEKCGERMITATRNNTDNPKTYRTTITRKQRWKEKQFYERFKRLINNISHKKTRTWLRKGNLKRETEYLLIAAQNNAIRTNLIKARCGDEAKKYIISLTFWERIVLLCLDDWQVAILSVTTSRPVLSWIKLFQAYLPQTSSINRKF